MNLEINQEEIKNNITIFQIFLVILSVYVLIALYVETAFNLSAETQEMVDLSDFLICIVFQGDFFYRFYKAPSKLDFLKWGWIDFVSSIPWFTSFRGGKMVRAIRILRLLRAFRSIKVLVRFLLRNRSQNAFVTVAVISCVLALVGSIMILAFEKDIANSNIKTPSDALWWAIVTVTTVGYGDRYPVTDEGRVVAAILMTAGVGLFGTFTGFVASMFVEPDIKREETQLNNLATELRAIREEMRAIDEKLDRISGDAGQQQASRNREERPIDEVEGDPGNPEA